MVKFAHDGARGLLDRMEIDDPTRGFVPFPDQLQTDHKTMPMHAPAGVTLWQSRQKARAFEAKLMFELKIHVKTPLMDSQTHTMLHLYKQNFKFSAAHFLIFDEKRAEKLHGHNYQVRVDIGVPPEADLSESGYYVDFNVFKTLIRERLALWDEMVLLPAQHPDLKADKKGKSLEVHFRDRFYVFPAGEVHLLPVSNTSVEQLSRLLAQEFFSQFQSQKVDFVRVRVEETRGQAASFTVRRSFAS